MKRTYNYTTKRCNAPKTYIDIFFNNEQHLMAYDQMDFYHLFGSTTSTYALRYRFLCKINSPRMLLKAFNGIGVELRGRNILIHIAYPIDVDKGLVADSMEAIHSEFLTPNKEIVIIPTLKRRIKFWQVKLYLFDEFLTKEIAALDLH